MGVICDLKLGGFNNARAGSHLPAMGVRPAEVADTLASICPWIVDAALLNFHGLAQLEKLGVTRCFRQWAANRVFYFYYRHEHSEHPVGRRKNNLRAVYREFYEAFAQDIAAERPITEEHARAFWRLVADRVTFVEPVLPVAAAETPFPQNQVQTVNAEGGAL